LKHEDIFRTPKLFGGEIKNLSNIYKAHVIIEQNKNSQNAKKISSTGIFLDCPIFWAEMRKKSTFITFPSRLKFPKLPEIFPSIF
jgi:hypothetical protein